MIALDEAASERLCLMIECHPDVTLEELHEAAVAYRGQEPLLGQQLARREQDAGRDGRQVMRTVQWLAGQI